MSNKKFLSVIIILFMISLCLPGIIYKASHLSNSKYGFCVSATNTEYHCVRYDTGYDCSKIEQGKPKNSEADMRAIDAYCGNDWNAEISEIDYGYEILLIGWGGLFVGVFAWYANLIFLVSLIGAWRDRERPRNLLIASAAAFLLGLDAFMFHAKPVNEAGLTMPVDHLAVGYYVWMASLALFVVYSYRKLKEVDTSQPQITEVLSTESGKII